VLIATLPAVLLLMILATPVLAVTGTVHGTVKDPGGTTAIDGATVVLYRTDHSVFGRVTTGAAGKFSFADVPDGVYSLRAYPPDGSSFTPSLPKAMVLTHGFGGNAGDVLLTNARIFGTVTEPDGTTPTTATVTLYNSMMLPLDRAENVTNFQFGGINTGNFWVQAVPPEGAPYRSAKKLVSLPNSTVTRTITLTLRAAGVYGVAVVDPGGTPLKGASVVARDVDHPSHWKMAMTNRDGKFAIGELDDGTYRLESFPPPDQPDLTPPAPTTFTISNTQPSYDAGVLTFTSYSKVVTGTVYLVQPHVRQPVGATARVVGTRLDQPGFSFANTEADGSYLLRLSGGLWLLSVHPITETSWVYALPPRPVLFSLDASPESRHIDLYVSPADGTALGGVQLPDTSPPPFTVTVRVRNAVGIGNNGPVAAGRFTVPVPLGRYSVQAVPQSETYGSVITGPVLMTGTVDVGTLTLPTRDAVVTGTVRDGSGMGIEGIAVVAWRPRAKGGGHYKVRTAADGSYLLSVVPGTWWVGAMPPISEPYALSRDSHPHRVKVASGEVVTDVDFTLLNADARIRGMVVDESGRYLWRATGFAFARPTTAVTRPYGSPVRFGLFDIKAISGTYRAGLLFRPNSPYVPGPTKEVSVGPTETVNISLTALTKDTVVSGQAVDWRTHTPVTGVTGTLIAHRHLSWQYASIDPSSGSYSFKLSGGDWQFRTVLEPGTGYVALPVTRTGTIHVPSSGSITVDLPVMKLDSMIKGQVLDADGDPQPMAVVFAQAGRLIDRWKHRKTLSDMQGYFTLTVPAGTFRVGANLPDQPDLIGPLVRGVTVSSTHPVTDVVLQFRRADGVVTGTVSLSSTLLANATTPPEQVIIWGWSPDGGHSETKADLNSTYTLPVISNTTWIVKGLYRDPDTGFYYDREVVDVGDGGAHQDLVLKGPIHMPPPRSVTFDAAEDQVIELEDGTTIQIPAKALADSGNVTLNITPIGDLPQQRHAETVNFGYALEAFDADGFPIDGTFNQDVIITFNYTDEEISSQGLTEEYLAPAYWSTTTGLWTIPDGYVVDTVNNQVTMEINHFTDFALTFPPSEGTGETTTKLYLPLIQKTP
jgi:hypothetical protein